MQNILKLVLAILVLVFLIFGGFWLYNSLSPNSQVRDNRIVVNIDKTTIVQQVKKINELSTVKQVLQRDFEIQLASTDLGVFGIPILESSRTQRFAVTGDINAGIDLSQITEDSVILNKEENQLKIILPAPRITSVNLMEDKIYLISDRSSFLYNVQNLNSDVNQQRTQTLQQELIKRGKQAMIDGACNNRILDTANENAKESLKELFLLVNQEVAIEVITTEPSECNFEGLL